MGKAAGLSDFDRGQIAMARRLGTSIFETARLVGCSLSTVVSTYAKWMNFGETSSRRHGVGRPHAIKEKGRRRLSRMELRQVLGYEGADLPSDLVHNTFRRYLRDILQHEESLDGNVLNVANAVLVDKRAELLEEYRRNVQELYRASVRDVDLMTESLRIVEEINDYVRENTNGKIDKLFDELDPSTVLVLLNAVYFKGEWKTQFDPKITSNGTFYNNGLKSEGRRIPLMYLTDRFPYASADNFQALELPYKGGNVSMFILLPNQRGGLQDLEESLTPERLEEIQRRLYITKVNAWIPKFKLRFEKELSPEIRALGANQIFSGAADFSGMTSRRNVEVSQVIHKAVIEVNEKGSEAAAVTGIIVAYMRASRRTPQFKVDHPFLFAILEKSSNMILFLGRVNNL
ncbi:unnamed protein product [Larinioides sclopetarius]|uniref:Serpin domain-containing protein n=1 Tax=Larinioides sclopetarius TaxID=280406 RepID=A0AAV2BQJ4_9ARAC